MNRTRTALALLAVAPLALGAQPVAKDAPAHAMHGAPAPRASAGALRAALHTLLQEHAYLAAAATGAALGGRTAEFQAAAATLDANSVDLSKAVGSVYGADAERAFLPLWRRHIGMVVDYTTGVAAKDQAKQQKAVADLLGYAGDLAAFLSGANPNLPKAAVEGLVRTHIVTLKEVIDVQARGDAAKSYAAARAAAQHMGMIADPLTDAIVKQFPAKFAN